MNGLNFDIKMLEVLVATAQCGSMTAAGQQLGLSQSAVSQTLANLETNVGVPLLDRSVRPVALTVAGRYFFDRSKHLIEHAQQTQTALSQRNFTRLHALRLAIVDSFAATMGNHLVAAIKSHSDQWMMTSGRSHMHQQALLGRQVDIVISDDLLVNHDNLQRIRLLKEPFILVLPKQLHKLHKSNDLKFLAKNHDFVRYTSNALIGQTIERYLYELGVNPPERIFLDNTHAVLAAVANGLGWTISTPLCVLQAQGLQENLHYEPLAVDDSFYRTLTLISRRNELGSLPERLAQHSASCLTQYYLPFIQQNLPWALKLIKVAQLG
ncbi:LysR family transcriptional regulator [Alginatibacterium sediminis]|uniref:LysR family transcriptional regulator n=1 Tax=Alginatibacterium sediminis TaxID=2164068 RepID=A0A420EH04_9ALTE|nr:LysR family transcriptional regulator [Alginatibacterium sediminis]RKF19948.1 LysR family transcriptional regulator [Alginatibacterium sediminis]